MAKVIDITDKLDFSGNPKLKIKEKEYEVNADAETVLKIMGILGTDKEVSPKAVVDMYELLFSVKDRKSIAGLKLQFSDFQKVVEAAIDLVVDNDETQGE